MKVSASFLSSKNPAVDLAKLDQTDVDYIHVDIMDGKFVPNKTMPFSEMKNIYKYTSKRLDVHLMVEKPEEYIPLYASLNTEYITIHVELDEDIMECLELIKSYSIKAGLSIKPNTKVSELIPYLPYIDMILIMSVEPGFGGQKFMDNALDKIKYLDNLRNNNDEYHYLIEVDGGVNLSNVSKIREAGANVVVMGTALINSSDKASVIKEVDNL